MIDLHSHILPGIDDGARTIADTIALAEQAVEQGVTHMVCTPHIHSGVFNNNRDTIKEAFDQSVEALRKHQIPLSLSYSCEVRLGIEITQWISSSSIPLLGTWNDAPALLLELPHSHIPQGTDSLIKWLLRNDIQPIVPHPERNRDILDNYDRATWLRSLGVLFQATAGSFTGTFGEKVEALTWRMLSDGLFNYVASDMHNLHRRPNEMAIAYNKIANLEGENLSKELFVGVPQLITKYTHWH